MWMRAYRWMRYSGNLKREVKYDFPVFPASRALGSGRSPGGGNGNPLQYFCLGNPLDRTWQTIVHRVTKSQTLPNSWACMHAPQWCLAWTAEWTVLWVTGIEKTREGADLIEAIRTSLRPSNPEHVEMTLVHPSGAIGSVGSSIFKSEGQAWGWNVSITST